MAAYTCFVLLWNMILDSFNIFIELFFWDMSQDSWKKKFIEFNFVNFDKIWA